jgi:hypothetical protein
MENRKNRYVEYVENNIANRNNIITHSLYNKTEKSTSLSKKESYRSYYMFDKSLYNHVEKYSSVKNYEGLVYVDRLTLDIDKHTMNDEELLESVKQCIQEIEEVGVKQKHINLWFSGNGYHIELIDVFGFQSSKDVHEKVKHTLSKLFEFADSIYDKSRIIRSKWGINDKTKLHKIYIPIKYLNDLTWEDIHKGAKNRESYAYFMDEYDEWFKELNSHKPWLGKPYLQHLIIDSPTVVKKTVSKIGETNSVVTCMQHVYNEGPVEGSRHQKILRMTSSYKRSGMPYLATLAALLEWNNDSLNTDDLTRSITNVYEQNYQYGCNDVIMNEYCDSKCIYYKNKNYTLDIKGVEELENQFRIYIQNDFAKQSIDMAEIWKVPSYAFKPGELIIFSGDTGMGKTALVQNIVTKAKKDTLFLSLEMSEHLTWRRFVQMATGKSKEWVNNAYLSNDKASFKELLRHIKILSIQPDLESIKKAVAEHRPNVLVVDTTEEIQVNYKQGIEKQNAVIEGLRDIAAKNNTIIFAIHHINKSSAIGGNLGLHSLKGSSNVVQKADKVIMIRGDRDEMYRVIESVKSRDEGSFSMASMFNYETMTFQKVEQETIC